MKKEYPEIPWIALTATAPKAVKDDVIKSLGFKNPVCFQISCFRPNLYYDVAYKNLLKDDFIDLKLYIEKCLAHDKNPGDRPSEKPCGIIYCRKRDTTESVALSLRKLGLSCAAFHSGLKPREKDQVQNDWMNGKLPVIAATVSFGMGIDKGPVRFVIHWDVSQSISEWYQESGRAGRDGKYSFCRVYYDRDEVKSISFLLKMEISKSKDKNADQLKKAELAYKEFQKISDHCEAAHCRHKLFTNFFGDAEPKCTNMCDACKNKKECEKNVEKFQQLTGSASLGSFRSKKDEDPIDLYEGGKWDSTNQGSFENYDDSGETSGFSTPRDVYKKEQRSIIDKQFALRKAQASEAMESQPNAQISRVKHPMSTERKVIGLKLSVREKTLTFIVDCLKTNKDKSEKAVPPEKPSHNLSYKDLEDIGKEIEYKIFSDCKAVSIYRRNIAQAVQLIKKCVGLYPDLKNHEPTKRQAFGGDHNSIMDDLKERYGADVVKELESEKSKKTERVKKNKFEQSGRDGLNQMKINSFFSKNPEKSPDDSSQSDEEAIFKTEPVSYVSSSSSDADLEKLEKIKENLEKELEAVKEIKKVEQSEQKAISIDGSVEEEDEAPLVIDEDPIDKGDGFPIESMKRKVDHTSKDQESNESKRPRLNEKSSCSSKPALNNVKTAITNLVLSELNPFYKSNKFKSDDPRGLFKIMARDLTHWYLKKNPTISPQRPDVKKLICRIFYEKGSIREVNDFKGFLFSKR